MIPKPLASPNLPRGYPYNKTMVFPLTEGEFDALIFDCDGTLVDTAPIHLSALQQALAPLGLTMTPEWYSTRNGLGPDQLLDEYEAEFKVASLARKALLDRSDEAYQASIPRIREIGIIADVARHWFGRVPLAVASNGILKNVEATLVATDLRPLFDTIVTSEQVAHGKPAPDVYLEAARRMNVAPTRCIVFEDTNEGLEAARRAGMKAYDVREVLQQHELQP